LPEWIARLVSPKCCRARFCFQALLAALVVVALAVIPSPARPKIALWLIVVLWPVIIPWAVIPAAIIVVVRAPRGIIALAVVRTLPTIVRLLVALIEIVKRKWERERDAEADLRLSRALGRQEQAACGEQNEKRLHALNLSAASQLRIRFFGR